MKAVERFRIPAGVPGRMCPAAVRAWKELSHAVYRASTLLRSPPTRPCNVCPSGVAQQPLAAAVVVIPLQIRPSACSRNEMRLAFSEASTGCPFRKQPCPFRNPRGGPTCMGRICAGRCRRAVLQCRRRARERSEPLPLPVAQFAQIRV